MAHEIEENDSMISVATVPWHGVGRILKDPPTWKDGLIAAGLNWKIIQEDVHRLRGAEEDEAEQIDGYQAIIREDTQETLAILSERYQPLQNDEAFQFFDPMLQNGLASLETAGSLRNGRKVWVLAKIKGCEGEVVKGDPVNAYFLLSNSHDGSSAVRIGFTPVRVVCANTMRAAHTSNESKLIRVFHSKKVLSDLEKLRETADLASQEFKATMDVYKQLAKRKISREDLEKYISVVLKPESEKAEKRLQESIIRLFEEGRGSDIAAGKGTIWRAYNAVNEFLNYEKGKDQDNRLDSLWFGNAGRTNDRALQEAIKLAA